MCPCLRSRVVGSGLPNGVVIFQVATDASLDRLGARAKTKRPSSSFLAVCVRVFHHRPLQRIKALYECIRVVLSGVKDVHRPMGSSLARPTKQLNVVAAAFYGGSSPRAQRNERERASPATN